MSPFLARFKTWFLSCKQACKNKDFMHTSMQKASMQKTSISFVAFRPMQTLFLNT